MKELGEEQSIDDPESASDPDETQCLEAEFSLRASRECCQRDSSREHSQRDESPEHSPRDESPEHSP